MLVLIQPKYYEMKKEYFSFFRTLKIATNFLGNLDRFCFHYACNCVYP